MKQTIGVIFTNAKVEDTDVAASRKSYTFNVSENVTVGDLIDSPNYKQKLQVVDIKDKLYTHFDTDGKLYTIVDSETDLPMIKNIKLVDHIDPSVVGMIVKE